MLWLGVHKRLSIQCIKQENSLPDTLTVFFFYSFPKQYYTFRHLPLPLCECVHVCVFMHLYAVFKRVCNAALTRSFVFGENNIMLVEEHSPDACLLSPSSWTDI